MDNPALASAVNEKKDIQPNRHINSNEGMTYKLFQEKVLNDGLMAFETSNGADWSLRTYANMAVRAVTREATNSGTLFADSDHDLYQISSHASSCPICAPLEGRIYSRSMTSFKGINCGLIWRVTTFQSPSRRSNG